MEYIWHKLLEAVILISAGIPIQFWRHGLTMVSFSQGGGDQCGDQWRMRKRGDKKKTSESEGMPENRGEVLSNFGL
jgi:hypothetical protein